MKEKVKKRRPGTTRISSKNQVTLPVDALRRTGLKAGDEVQVEADGTGRLVLVRADDVLAKYAGSFGYPGGYLEKLRDEWR